MTIAHTPPTVAAAADADAVLTVRQAMRVLGIGRREALAALRTGELVGWQGAGGRWLVDMDSVIEAARRRLVPEGGGSGDADATVTQK